MLRMCSYADRIVVAFYVLTIHFDKTFEANRVFNLSK